MLNLLDTHCLTAKGESALVAIDCEAYSREDCAKLRFGIVQARR